MAQNESIADQFFSGLGKTGDTQGGRTVPPASSVVSSFYANIKPVARTVAPPPTPQQFNDNVFQKTVSTVKNTIKDIKLDNLKGIGKALIAGTKQLPGTFTQVGGLIAGAWVNQQQAMNNFFKTTSPAVKQALFNINPNLKYLEPIQSAVEKLATKYVEPKAFELRDKGVEMSAKTRQEYEKNKKPSSGAQAIAESVAYNIPQVLASTGLSIATSIITKNPALATSIGLGTTFGLGASEVYDRARADGLSDKQAMPLALVGGSLIGIIDYLPLSRLLEKTGAAETIKKSLIKNIASNVVGIGTQSGFEGITEAIQEIIGNAVARTYNEHQNLLEGVPEALIVGSIIGGGSDIAVNTVNKMLGMTGKGESSIKEVEAKIEDAILTPPEKRTLEQQAIADAVLVQNLTPDDAMSFVIENDLGKTETGKEIVKLVVQAKQQDKNILIRPSNEPGNLDVELVDPGMISGEISQPAKQITLYRGGKTGGESFSTSKSVAEDFSKNRGGTVKEYILDPNAKIIDFKDVPNVKFTYITDDILDSNPNKLKFMEGELEVEYKKAADYARKNGYDAIRYPTEGEIRILNKNIIKSNQPLQQTSEGGKVITSNNDFTYKPATDLSPEEAKIEKRFGDLIKSDPDSLMKKYIEKFGIELNTDNVREFSSDYEGNRSLYSRAVHEPASAFTKYMYERLLNTPDPQGKDLVMFTAGGTGAGKTTAIANIPETKAIKENAKIVYDSNMNTLETSIKRVDQALDSGHKVVIAFIEADIKKAYEQMVSRAVKRGRTVPLKYHIATHLGANEVIFQLAEHYKSNPNVDFKIIDNTGNVGEAKASSLELLAKKEYNKVDRQRLYEELKTRTEQKFKNGEISKDILRGIRGNEGQAESNTSQNNGINKSGNDSKSSQGEVITTTGTPGPVGSGKTKQSKAYTRVVDRLQEETRLLTTYNELNLKQDAENAIAFIESNPKGALRVALGIDSPPQGQTETAISIALADRAAQEGNFQLQSHLESSRSLRQTRRGQEIVSERGRFNDESPYRYVQEVLDRRLREIGKGVIPSTKEEVESIMSKGGSKKRAVDKVEKVARQLKKKLDREQAKINLAQDIINSLIC